MKKSGFKTKTLEEVRAKQAAKRAKLASKPRKTPKPKKVPSKVNKTRTKLPAIKTMRNKCDKLLTPIIKAQYPYCFLKIADGCSGYTEVAHHHIKKSQSSAVRYELSNLIPLCHKCHMKLHSQETTWASLIVEKKGIKWWKKVYNLSVRYTKTDVHFYIENYNRLSKILEKVTTVDNS